MTDSSTGNVGSSVAGACPVCRSRDGRGLFVWRGAPIHQNLLAATLDEALTAPRGDMDIRICRSCGFVWNAAFDASLLRYGAEYDNSQDHSPTFRDYRGRLAARLVQRFDLRGRRVVEIGCGKGSFLVDLEVHGIGEGIGFDPSYDGPSRRGRLRFVRAFYGPEHGDLAPDFVGCRHVIEHVPDPVGLLRGIGPSRGADRPPVFFETPDVRWIFEQAAVWDFFYEHCSYFSPESARRAFRAAGFEVSVTTAFAGQYLWIESGGTRAGAGDADELVVNGLRFARQRESLLSALRDRVCRAAPCVIWGAGAKGVTLLNLLGPAAGSVAAVVDINPVKQGRLIPGTGHRVVGPAAPEAAAAGLIMVMNPQYADEIGAMARDMGSKAVVEVV